MSCVTLMLPQPYANSCYGHVMSKCCQYPINNLKVYDSMKEVSIKYAYVSLQKKLLHGPKKTKREGKNGQKLVEMHLFTFIS
jgi:hypothetical protein